MEEPKEEIQAKIIIEVLGKPKEHVETSLKDYIEQIKKDKSIQILNTDFADATEKEDLWAAFADMEITTKSLPHLIGFCFDYMPSSIDIIKPEHLNMNQKSMSDFLNDLQARLHEVDMVAKNMKTQNDFLRRNMNSLINNYITLLLRSSPLKTEQMEKFCGISSKELEKYLEALIKEKKVEKIDDKFRLVKN